MDFGLAGDPVGSVPSSLADVADDIPSLLMQKFRPKVYSYRLSSA